MLSLRLSLLSNVLSNVSTTVYITNLCFFYQIFSGLWQTMQEREAQRFCFCREQENVHKKWFMGVAQCMIANPCQSSYQTVWPKSVSLTTQNHPSTTLVYRQYTYCACMCWSFSTICLLCRLHLLSHAVKLWHTSMIFFCWALSFLSKRVPSNRQRYGSGYLSLRQEGHNCHTLTGWCWVIDNLDC